MNKNLSKLARKVQDLTTLDYAESKARKVILMYMKEWVQKLDAFLQFYEEAILKHQGKVSHQVAIALVEGEFEK